MTYRLDIRGPDRATLELHGVLDEEALGSLRAAVEAVQGGGIRARIVLRRGAEVERRLLPALRALDAELSAESPYLARWLAAELATE